MLQKFATNSVKYNTLSDNDKVKFETFFKLILKLSKNQKLFLSNGILDISYCIINKFNSDNTLGTYVIIFDINIKKWKLFESNKKLDLDTFNLDENIELFEIFNPTISQLIDFTYNFSYLELCISVNKFNNEILKYIDKNENKTNSFIF